MSSLRLLLVQSRFYADIADALLEGATAALRKEKALCDCLEVPGALEIPPAIKRLHESGAGYDAFVALGCVLRGETAHYDIVAGESARALMDLGARDGLAVGNGILTCDTKAQAMRRALKGEGDKGGDAARAALALLTLKTRISHGDA